MNIILQASDTETAYWRFSCEASFGLNLIEEKLNRQSYNSTTIPNILREKWVGNRTIRLELDRPLIPVGKHIKKDPENIHSWLMSDGLGILPIAEIILGKQSFFESMSESKLSGDFLNFKAHTRLLHKQGILATNSDSGSKKLFEFNLDTLRWTDLGIECGLPILQMCQISENDVIAICSNSLGISFRLISLKYKCDHQIAFVQTRTPNSSISNIILDNNKIIVYISANNSFVSIDVNSFMATNIMSPLPVALEECQICSTKDSFFVIGGFPFGQIPPLRTTDIWQWKNGWTKSSVGLPEGTMSTECCDDGQNNVLVSSRRNNSDVWNFRLLTDEVSLVDSACVDSPCQTILGSIRPNFGIHSGKVIFIKQTPSGGGGFDETGAPIPDLGEVVFEILDLDKLSYSKIHSGVFIESLIDGLPNKVVAINNLYGMYAFVSRDRIWCSGADFREKHEIKQSSTPSCNLRRFVTLKLLRDVVGVYNIKVNSDVFGEE